MKNLLVLIMVILSLTSCSKDTLDLGLENISGPEKSEIMVRVSYLVWMGDQCLPGCGGNVAEEVAYLPDASVKLFIDNSSQTDSPGSLMEVRDTDKYGKVLLEDLEPATYTVIVETPLGTKSRSLTTQLNKRSFIDFSF